MNDKELADRCVALGVGAYDAEESRLMWSPGASIPVPFQSFVRDWRVAGACLEKEWGFLEKLIALNQIDHIPETESLPRALIEAFVKD